MDMNRKEFIAGIGAGAVGLSMPLLVFAKRRDKRIISLSRIKPLRPVSFNYPDKNSPAVLLDMNEPVYMGIGPKKSIVAFSVLCQHMGCPLNFDRGSKLFVCPCHLSAFDPKRGGLCVQGPAINRLPMIALRLKRGHIYAVGVAYGLIYGRAKNF